MILKRMRKTIVFDLDDTLVPEMDYLESAYLEIAQKVAPHKPFFFQEMLANYHKGVNVFEQVIEEFPIYKLQDLIHMYRNHYPKFPQNSSFEILRHLKSQGNVIGLITDGYSVTQRNKIQALGIENLLDKIIISEEFGTTKPTLANYTAFHEFQSEAYYYIGDNVKKDFITPNALGWTTICLLDKGRNVHPQNFEVENAYLPHFTIQELKEISTLVS
ncbi:MAG: hypothetical protein RL607_531 [Bacteroidota bacterium]|jgi:putative hydrolase of the HAD superfamily